MPNLNLELDETRLFGKFFPSVFIDRVVIAYPSPVIDGVQDPTANLEFQTKLTLNITKPADVSIGLVEWVQKNMKHLSLYTCLSPFKELNDNIDESKLNFKEFFRALKSIGVVSPSIFKSSSVGFPEVIAYIIEAFVNNWHAGDGYALTAYTEAGGALWNDTYRRANIYNAETDGVGQQLWGLDDEGNLNINGPWDVTDPDCFVAEILGGAIAFMGTGDSHSAGAKLYQIPLTDIIVADDDPSDYAGKISSVSYDAEGNEIIEVSEIPIVFSYGTADDDESDEDEIQEAILQSIEKLYLLATVGPTEMINTYADVADDLFNASFGNITYEWVMNSGAAPPQEEIVYLKISSGDTVHDVPIQARNQKYYEPNPVNQQMVVESLNVLIDNFRETATRKPRLFSNIQNLEVLLETEDKSMSLVPKLFAFGASYVGKDRASESGAFFIAFSEIMRSYNEAIMLQEQLSKNLVLNDRVLDRRPSFVGSTSYWHPNPLGADYLSPDSWALSRIGDDFIPTKWAMQTRYVEETIPTYGLLSDFVEFAIGEGYATGDYMMSMGAERYTEDVRASWFGVGSVGSPEHPETTTGNPHTPGEGAAAESAMATELMAPMLDSVVANKGFWFFDYEKALHRFSLLAQCLNLRRIQDLFHVSIPYKYFWCSRAAQGRREYELNLQNWEYGELIDPWRVDSFIDIRMDTFFWESTEDYAELGDSSSASKKVGSSYPRHSYTQYTYDPTKMKYGQPFVTVANSIDMYADGFSDMVTMKTVLGLEGDPEADEMLAYMGYTEETGWAGSPFSNSLGAIIKSESEWGTALSDEAMAGALAGDGSTTGLGSYLQWANGSNIQSRSNSFLKHQTIECAAAAENMLINFNPYPATEALDAVEEGDGAIQTAPIPIAPADGYRIMCFQYRDYMDDDVAYYNTYGSYNGDRNGVVAGLMAALDMSSTTMTDAERIAKYTETMEAFDADPLSFDTTPATDTDSGFDVWTKYEVGVTMNDATIRWFTTVLVTKFKESLANFEFYLTQCKQICSENNITGRFTDDFAVNITAYYDDRDLVYPWVEAAWMYNAIRDLFLNTFSGSHQATTNIEAIVEAARRDADKISPSQATIQVVEEFWFNLRKLIALADPALRTEGMTYHPIYERFAEVLDVHLVSDYYDLLFDDDGELLVTGGGYDAVKYHSARTTTYTNTIPIDQVIYGNLALSAFWDNAIPDAPSSTCTEDDTSAPGGLPSMSTPAGWLSCVWPTYVNMKAGIGLGTVDPLYTISDEYATRAFGIVYDAAYDAALAAGLGDALAIVAAIAASARIVTDEVICWQESVLVQAFINEFRQELEDTLPTFPSVGGGTDQWAQFKPVGDPGNYSEGAWFWPPRTAGAELTEYANGPDPSNFIWVLREAFGVTNEEHLKALARGWQTLHVGTPMEAYDYGDGYYDIGPHIAPTPAMSASSYKLPPKFGFIPSSITNPNPTWTWPRTMSPEAPATLGMGGGDEFGHKVNKIIYAPDCIWDPDELGVDVTGTSTMPPGDWGSIPADEAPEAWCEEYSTWGDDGGLHSTIPTFFGLALMFAGGEGPPINDNPFGYSGGQGVRFQQEVGFVDVGSSRDNVICFSPRDPYNAEEYDELLRKSDYFIMIRLMVASEFMAEISDAADEAGGVVIE